MMGEADEFQDTDPRSLGGEAFTTDTLNTVLDRPCDTTTNHHYNQENSNNSNSNKSNNNNRKQDTICNEKNSLSLVNVDSSSNSSNLDYNSNTLTTHVNHHTFSKNNQNSNRLEQEQKQKQTTLAEGTVVSDHPTLEEKGVPSTLFSEYDSSSQKNHNDESNMQSATLDSSLLYKSGLDTAIDEHQGTRKKCKFND